MTDVQIPGKAISDATDVRQPTRDMLEDLNLLGSATETEKAGTFSAVFSGPPQSVAVIEAGLTAGAKWWAAGLGASTLATWGTVVKWWGDQEDSNLQIAVLVGAAIVTAALVVSLGYLLASDVRGRASASVATIEARALVAETMIRAAAEVYTPPASAASIQLIALPRGIRVRNHKRPAGDEEGWRAVAIERHPDGHLEYVVVKGSSEATEPASGLSFE